MSPEKRVDRAIDIARAVGAPLRIAAKIDAADRDYYERCVAPRLPGEPRVDFVGEIDEPSKQGFLGNARALLWPIDWPEPFGLAVIEAMSCGTPVIAWNCGSTPEIVDDGVTGFVVDSIDAAIDALRRADRLDRRRIRAQFERRFTARRMALDYVQLYERLVSRYSTTSTSA
jgi:glycosyltransferase involved in cell wall biosynthesis